LALEDDYVGRELSLGYALPLAKRYAIVPHLRIHLDNVVYDNQNRFFQDRFRTVNPREHIGMSLEFRRFFVLPDTRNHLFAFANMQITRIGIRAALLNNEDDINDEDDLYVRRDVRIPAFITLDNSLGIGMQAALSNRLFLQLKAGAGVAVRENLEPYFYGESWDLSYLLSVGIFWVQ
jgi:hypothetical protein